MAFDRVTRKVVTFASKIMQGFEHQVLVSIYCFPNVNADNLHNL